MDNLHLKFIEDLPKQFGHASNLVSKWNNKNTKTEQKEKLTQIFTKYVEYIKANSIKGYTPNIIQKRVKCLNEYYNFLHYQECDKLFTSQSKFRPSILEEFIYILFRDYVAELKSKYDKHNLLDSGSIKAYTNLFFKAKDFKEYIGQPAIGVNTKDQDYAIYRLCELIVNKEPVNIRIPAVAVEVKTYIDKTMLDSIIATAEKLKTGNPYTRFIAIAEYYEVGSDVDPAYSRIDQIYILRKCKRKEKGWVEIDYQVVQRIFNEVKQHIERPWSDIEQRLQKEGVIL